MRGLGWKAWGTVLGLALAGSAGAQTMTEFGAAAATGTVGGVAGKKVSDGITAVFGKVDQQTKAAAKQAAPEQEKAATSAAATVSSGPISSGPISSGPGPSGPAPARVSAARPKPAPASKAPVAKAARSVAKSKPVETGSVPDPPAAAPSHPTAVSKAPEPPVRAEPAVEIAAVAPASPAPPEVTAENLRSITPGATREDLLKLGSPNSRITMFGDDGHLLEIYSYMTKGTTFGVVRLSDGAVSKVELR